MVSNRIRKVKIIKRQYMASTGKVDKVITGFGYFHGFGCNYEEFDGGPGNYTTGIIEFPDGSMRNMPLQEFEFVSPISDEIVESEFKALGLKNIGN
jgi:hypothetical protein